MSDTQFKKGALRLRLLCATLAAALASPVVAAEPKFTNDVVKIGILNDQSGLYADLAGPGSVEAARMAIEEFGGTVLGKKVELVFADHQNKADIGAAKAREWFSQDGVDVIADFSNSSVGFAVQSLAKDMNKIALITAASSDFTGKACTDTSAQWVYTSYTNGYGLARIMTAAGYDSWFLVTVDYAFGHAFANDIRKAVTASGGTVLGEVRHPLNSPDMSSFLLQAQSSKAKIVAFSSAGSDMANAIKQAAEFGLNTQKTLVAPAVFLTDIHALGLEKANGLRFVTAFYWDRNDETRQWSRRFFDKRKAMPTMTQAGVYSAVRHYLRAVEAAQTDDAKVVMAKMKELPVDDMFSRGGRVRADGQMIHDMYLVEVKKPAESKGPWDYYKIVQTIPGDQIFPPLSDSACPLVK
ncbi:branched-chain amino acid ABC transporter substrate-binding protein [Azorhizobium oxalatiphilum]|uniref:Branched-chain amino acid ABC transporter substrate-binding protein n=1 Tax=Azorhizobium oxalatiphilum TaxID=980631 RepID=A0A917FDP3_9HYPH|nr:ABC transporter substrate-binding protein [Azorhizobium oxalatiphilum]GGF68190.1 branched-chain amino acid ABC transporter substrate-binding protein [Azorhizobium oxalatiphilum]